VRPSLTHFEGTFEKLDQQLFAMRNANYQLTPEERSCDQLYSSVPGGIHQPCNTDYTNLDYEGYLCEVYKQAWATPEEGKVLLLGMCEISTSWKESTCGFQEALAFVLRLKFLHYHADNQHFSKSSRMAIVNTLVLWTLRISTIHVIRASHPRKSYASHQM
jgi:hypothetical protein